ncbi:DNA polymerase III subunit epsilon [Acidihalobacter aeolianus]|uniref:DNA polymerase III subunit epsilon n=1 Tax=Acidihalobacter aeolianus TaxID=2792603 RepID=A0A1D8K8T7_9GAMM|nr:DNA polymerase III subunit epsilon [Acidihalobacter aeolianus]AOV17341.1 DNA polymerase III subunit epsilon [Acidihalobacter aeolianus]
MRQIVLDTETTGLEPEQGHRVIEIGCVELFNRRPTGRHFHQYLQPDREIDEGAAAVHGITAEFLADKPRFADVADEFLAFVSGAELVIHNAPFDLGFLNAELRRYGHNEPLSAICGVVDSLVLARQMHPGQRNSLDALCKRYGVNNEHRELHGALLDAQILADVYLVMTGGQTSLLADLQADNDPSPTVQTEVSPVHLDPNRPPLRVISASSDEIARHASIIDLISGAAEKGALWH